MTTGDFKVPEEEVARQTGLSLKVLRTMRGQEGDWFKKGAAGRILWSPDGVAALESRLAQKNAAEATPEPKNAPQADTFTVVRMRTPMVLHVVAEGETYDPLHPRCVWMPKAGAPLFRPGMKLLATHRQEHLWDFAGNPERPELGRRLPRRAGRW